MADTATLPITVDIAGQRIERDRILDNEDRRIDAAAAKLGISVPPAGDVVRRREELLHAKLELGTEEIRRRLHREVTIAGAVARTAAVLTPRRRTSVVDVYSPTGSAALFTDFYRHCVQANDEAALLRAHPDHFVQRIGSDGRHEVIETTGGSPLAAHFLIDYDDASTLSTPAAADFPEQLTGVALDGRTAIGGVRHQFRDTADGFQARLTVEFPWLTAGRMIRGHRWHLAVEFSNWIEAAVARAG